MEIDVDGEDFDLKKRLHGLCRDLLSNPVIEDYELQKSEDRGRRTRLRPGYGAAGRDQRSEVSKRK
jgi:Phosphoribosylformylglycinamidine (FGAM) synthase